MNLRLRRPLLSKLAVTKTKNTDYDSRKGAKGAKFRVESGEFSLRSWGLGARTEFFGVWPDLQPGKRGTKIQNFCSTDAAAVPTRANLFKPFRFPPPLSSPPPDLIAFLFQLMERLELLKLLLSFGRQRTREITIGKMSNGFAGFREGSSHLGARVDPEDREV